MQLRRGMLQGAEVRAALERQAAARGAWLEAMRDGVHQLLRSKTGPRQRHGALQLAGAMASLAGSSWLLGSSKACLLHFPVLL